MEQYKNILEIIGLTTLGVIGFSIISVVFVNVIKFIVLSYMEIIDTVKDLIREFNRKQKQ